MEIAKPVSSISFFGGSSPNYLNSDYLSDVSVIQQDIKKIFAEAEITLKE